MLSSRYIGLLTSLPMTVSQKHDEGLHLGAYSRK